MKYVDNGLLEYHTHTINLIILIIHINSNTIVIAKIHILY